MGKLRFLLAVSLLLVSSISFANPVTHIVLLWFNPGTPQSQVELIKEKTLALANIPGIESIKLGAAIKSDRPMVDGSFSLGINFTIDSQESMQAFLKHPQHQALVKEEVKPYLLKMKVYDF